MPTLVLASTSTYRRQLVARLGVPCISVAPSCDEDALKEANASLAPAALAAELARAKARSVAPEWGAAHHILGSDQLVEIEGEILGKPGSPERAVAQLTQLTGRAHRLITAYALLCPDGAVLEHVDVHVLHMRALTQAELTRYVSIDQPLDCAGSYKIEALGIALFERIEGCDFTAIMGLPLVALTTQLRAQGFVVP
jgi:septum formation protein